jgi:hypothetical protein
MVTGPMPRKPNATRPKAKTASAIIKVESPCWLTPYATAMSVAMTPPIQ